MSVPVNILLVDDQAVNLDALEAILESPEHRLVRALSADEALLALLKSDFAAIVLDIRMPGVSGIELAELIKQRKRSQHIPIIFLTAHLADEQEVLRGYGVGAVDYLSKPINPRILRSKVAVLVDLFRTTRALEAANEALQEQIRQRESAQAALVQANEALEARVADRTRELEAAISEAKSANQAKDHFLAVLSHELRTPLTPVLMSVQLLEREESLDDRTRRTMGMIRRNIELEARLIDDLLDLTRVSKGKVILNIQDVDINLVLRQAVQTCSVDAAEKGIRLQVNQSDQPLRVRGDPGRLQQVFWNLIKNAIKFTPAGGEVTISSASDGSFAQVSVLDSGIGIDRSRLPYIFDAFEQGGAGTTQRFGGLGLGLAISKSLVELCGGTIKASSEGSGRGSEFTVCMALAEEGRDGTATDIHASRDTLHSHFAARILLVEDHDDTAGLLSIALQSAGHSVERANSVASALQMAQRGEFDLLISDLGLPDGSGHDLARRLLPQRPLPAIALSGYGMEEDIGESRAAGFREHLIKPVNFEQLNAAIERVLTSLPSSDAV